MQDHQGWRRQSEASTTGSIASNNLTVVGSSGSGPGGNDGSSKIRRVSIQPEDAELEVGFSFTYLNFFLFFFYHCKCLEHNLFMF